MRRFLSIAATCLLATACGSPPPEPVQVGGSAPVTAERLRGARLESVGTDPGVTWRFTDAEFTVAGRGGPLPADVVEPLLGPGARADRVEGTWRMDDAAATLVLTRRTVPGEAPAAAAAFPVQGAGQVRCDLGQRQYNVFPSRR